MLFRAFERRFFGTAGVTGTEFYGSGENGAPAGPERAPDQKRALPRTAKEAALRQPLFRA